MVRKIIYILSIILLISSVALFSETAFKKNNLFIFVNQGSGITENDFLFLTEILKSNINTIEKINLIEHDYGAKTPEKENRKTDIAKKAGADLWLEISINKEEKIYNCDISCFNIQEQKIILNDKYAMDDTFKNIENKFWKEFINDFIELVKEIKTVTTFGTSYIEIKGIPGSTVKGLSNQIKILDENGKAFFAVEGNRSYFILVRKDGYKSLKQTVFAESGNISIELNQVKYNKNAYTAGMQNGGPTASYVYFLVPESVYFEAGFSYTGTYLWPEYFNVEPTDWLANTFSLFAEIGKIYGSDYKRIQFFNSVRGVFNYMIPADEFNQSPQVHPLFPLGVSLVGGMKINTGKNSSILIALMPAFYPKIKSTEEAELLAAEWEAEGDTDLESYPYEGMFVDGGSFVFTPACGRIVFSRTF